MEPSMALRATNLILSGAAGRPPEPGPAKKDDDVIDAEYEVKE